MKEFSEIKNGKITILDVKDTYDWHFRYNADENPTQDIGV